MVQGPYLGSHLAKWNYRSNWGSHILCNNHWISRGWSLSSLSKYKVSNTYTFWKYHLMLLLLRCLLCPLSYFLRESVLFSLSLFLFSFCARSKSRKQRLRGCLYNINAQLAEVVTGGVLTKYKSTKSHKVLIAIS